MNLRNLICWRSFKYLLGLALLAAVGWVLVWPGTTTPPAAAQSLAIVSAVGETVPVESSGDAADDPAIWYNAQAPERSLILGTDKRRGLEVYDLAGERVQSLPVGRLNNVDLRQDVLLDGRRRDIAVATHRDTDSLAVFEIDAAGEVSLLGKVATGLKEIYGVCLYRHEEELHVFTNGKDGSYLQHRLEIVQGAPQVELLRFFRLDSQPEACVADDARSMLFVGEESFGVWVMRAAPDAGTSRELVVEAQSPLEPDIEGLALYGDRYLIVSSQGNHRFVVLEASPPYRLVGVFRVDEDSESGIGSVRETDGIEVSAHSFGERYPMGLMVVQSGRNASTNQNYKYLDWAQIAEALELPGLQ
ncbi:phytase [Halomonas sp. MCCC 1A11062]|uniref:phytase n=1 Tax=Halomonas sp. MCCC 1A11062 TaxID=2733485 RepID=UPI001F198269|nr:phytase [Halomonas sp. MCCC 1A11062]MCE8038670.1 phytase [Halomonas sp. MCCC 1A11062]